MSVRQEIDGVTAVAITVNGETVMVPPGASAAVAIMMSGAACRVSVSGEPRGPLCGMGICMECCATVDGIPHVRSCQVVVKAGMEIVTG
jgi:D-hydroxyproline dehydrogenase subunit gamma